MATQRVCYLLAAGIQAEAGVLLRGIALPTVTASPWRLDRHDAPTEQPMARDASRGILPAAGLRSLHASCAESQGL